MQADAASSSERTIEQRTTLRRSAELELDSRLMRRGADADTAEALSGDASLSAGIGVH